MTACITNTLEVSYNKKLHTFRTLLNDVHKVNITLSCNINETYLVV